ncbi:Crp/Fnr family transcriptional regulator [Qipengyuania sp.]|uniref:Crp/Fnr family transcriptional regulator n=1 Tax=Qipengyuania sp. TaxID=2004515 RepID=UPI0035C794A8
MFVRKFLLGRLRHELTEDELERLESAVNRIITIEPRTTLVDRGTRLENSYYLIEGTMLRHLDDKRGERQLVGVNIAGDFVDLHGYAMKRLDHSVQSLDRAKVAEVPHIRIKEMLSGSPHLARLMWFSTLLDAAMHREWIFRLGRLNAEGRIAHLISELIERLRFVGLFDGLNFPIPLLQRDYAEACGITPVHANRSFRTLKERGVLELDSGGKLRILDEAELKSLCDFDGSYLYGQGELQLDNFEDLAVNA